jgi:nucleotide-binding universal stress UspA family protein
MKRILLAVNDTPAGIAAARAAVALAALTSAQVRAIHVLDGPPSGAAPPAGEPSGSQREAGSAAVLRFVSEMAAGASVPVQTATLHGRPATLILETAAAWPADLIVLGRAGYRRVGAPFVGSEVLHVLEFAEVPVLVVPAR